MSISDITAHIKHDERDEVKSLLEESDGKELKGLAKFFEDEKRLSLLEEIIEHGSERVAAVARMLDELEPHEKALIFVEYTNHTMDFLKRDESGGVVSVAHANWLILRN